ncbi:ATPase AAA [Thermosipho melanesiensis]|uniref:Phosphoribulokinase/uridine kinase n=2 Tax=Thermosipho melanesiensis TaxID=46541 RepID=A6LNV1_THEM4|nr:nucleoside kinase [Thermosipho melanesiensis]ABR31602.1 phosphoribulokinase/uridine kinase [Thermosipho melanesiensis BI429]APT74633.1 ATPase AAA [Thermosipho melanesiensis]OOC35338.1 ATPase AAA [Thermosipho melanesiensis]OOC35555.1 ATPase AAA [Thermosipho melanesiensis]OOC36592.1 ATPase AAA [Thermosipho melanesiensis]
MEKIRLEFLDDGRVVEVEKGSTLENFVGDYFKYYKSPIVAAKVNNNNIVELFRPLSYSGKVVFLDVNSIDGFRIYQRGLLFILKYVLKKIYPNHFLKVSHSIGKSIYCELKDLNNNLKVLSDEEIENVKSKMFEVINKNERFLKMEFFKSEALKLFDKLGYSDKVNLLKYRKKKTVKVYKLDEHFDYFYGYMPHSTGVLKYFDLFKYEDGFVLVLPVFKDGKAILEFKPMTKLSQVFIEYKKWLEIMNIDSVGDLNRVIASGERSVTDLIIMSEALHEKKIAFIAEEIKKKKTVRLVLIAGPSSSGKTTFSKRLMVQLRASGLRPVTISLDDYFVDREKTPVDENGKPDFEALEAIDVELFNRNLLDLFEGKEVEIPKFDFTQGKRKKGRKLKIEKDQPIIVEGIHGLNPKLTELIPEELKYKIYASALTQLNLDNTNRLHTTDTRLLRRIVRDSKFRGHDALATLRMWPSVRRGEDRNIFPYQENADIMFNSALVYEISVLKIFAEQLLIVVPDDKPEYSEVTRLLKILDYFLPITNIEDIPRTSLIREFIGRSVFKY